MTHARPAPVSISVALGAAIRQRISLSGACALDTTLNPGHLFEMESMARKQGDAPNIIEDVVTHPGSTGFTLLAREGERITGHVTIGLDITPSRAGEIADLQARAIFVDTHRRGQGLARRLSGTAADIMEGAIRDVCAAAPDAVHAFDVSTSGAPGSILRRLSTRLEDALEEIESDEARDLSPSPEA